jgi:hypothetical protein
LLLFAALIAFVRVLNSKGRSWKIERLRCAVHRLVRERIAEPALIKRPARRAPEDRLMNLVAGIAIADPELSLRDIAVQLERMHERTPRGGRQWQASSAKAMLNRARRLGLAAPDPVLTHDTADQPATPLGAGYSFQTTTTMLELDGPYLT